MEPQPEPDQATLTTATEHGGNGASAEGVPAAEERATAPPPPSYVIPKATHPHPVPAGAPLDHPTPSFNRELSWLDFNSRVPAQALDEPTPLAERVPCPATAPHDPPTRYFNRELSWLDFNWRVLAQALDERTPLLERVRFLAIAANNLDEFIRKRVGGLKRQHAAGVRALSPDGRTPKEQLDLVVAAARPMQLRLCETWEHVLRPRLEAVGVVVRDYASLTEAQREALDAHFRSAIFPILTPLAVDPGHPFPFLSNLSLSLAVMLRHPARGPSTSRG